ncbi:Crp/Fnr family transcriptional regulator [Lichenibacterium dinghuense]|uniref:Crp/Fnr family transcriptional regulator n=1 Tax=Lichenibacterium dinghuense TaxID=2895977 RepID=UPI001F352545|nr:Crp/Fnr family transcriptional regulator [Lichenibacterium sp. 6Y81]
MEARSDVLRQGEVPSVAHVLLHGHTCRYRLLSDGRRQITAVLLPGDMCDLEAVMRGRADYGVGALTTCILGEIPAERVADPTTLDPEMSRALWRRLLRDEAISREWLVRIGRRTALERVAHLLCELRVRVDAIGLAVAEEFDMQFTQVEFADILGMSTGHIDRVLQQLCRTGLIALSRGVITVLDMPTMEMVAGFDPSYLRAA